MIFLAGSRAPFLLLPVFRFRLSLLGGALMLLSVTGLTALLWSAPAVANSVSLPGTPMAVAINPATNRLYLTTNNPSIAVWSLDGSGTGALRSVTLGGGFLGALAVTAVTEHVYVADVSGRVSVLAGASNTELTSVVISAIAHGMAVNPWTNRVYVTSDRGDGRPAGTVVVLDGERDTVLTQVQIGRGRWAWPQTP